MLAQDAEPSHLSPHLAPLVGASFSAADAQHVFSCNDICPVMMRVWLNMWCILQAELRAAVQAGACPGKDIVFANACKRPRDIRAAASMGVNLTTFDTPCEVQKLARYHPGTAVLLRIRADDPDARCAVFRLPDICLELVPAMWFIFMLMEACIQ